MFEPNKVIDNKYNVIKMLVETNTAQVYEVSDREGHHKVLKLAKTLDTTINNQMKREATFLARMNYDAIPKLYDRFIYKEKYQAIVMEKKSGITLAQLIEKEKAFLLWKDIVKLTDQFIDFFTYIHQLPIPLLYLDLKPSNIIVSDNFKVHMIDFGNSKEIEEESHSFSFGTIGFAAPEQFEVGKQNETTDLFAFGVVLFYILSGGANIYTSKIETMQTWPDIPQSYSNFIEILTNSDPTERYQDIDHVKRAFYKVKYSYKERLTNKLKQFAKVRK